MLIGRAIKDRRDKALVSVKFGALRTPDGGWIGIDARPASVKNFVAYSLGTCKRQKHCAGHRRTQAHPTFRSQEVPEGASRIIIEQYHSVKPKTLGRDAKFRVSTGLKSAPKILNPSVLHHRDEQDNYGVQV